MEADASPVAQEHVEEAQEEDSVAAEDGHDALVSSEQDREEYQEYNDDGGVDMDGQQDGAQDEEHMQAIVTQQEEYKDELPDEHRENDKLPEEESENDENAEPVHQIQISIQEDVEMEQDADGNVVHAEIETDIVVRDDSPNDGQDLLNGDEDGLISGTPRPFAAAIFS
jgi:sRNA-binding protein